MTKRVLIIGGYGNFGRFITSVLARESDLQIIIAGRRLEKARELAQSISANAPIETAAVDIHDNLEKSLGEIAPNVVIHTSGPFQDQGYKVAEACILQGSHYIDLADAREFVTNICSLDSSAKKRGVLVTSGASSVPTLTSAIIDEYVSEFETLEEIEYAISSAQLTNQGLATTQAILSYVGKPFKTLLMGKIFDVYGWQGLVFRKFWGLNIRALGYCNVPDLDIFPKRYPSLKSLQFRAGIESKIQHVGLFMMSWLVRLKLAKTLQPLASALLKISRLFNVVGTNNSGFYMILRGKNQTGCVSEVLFEIVAHNGDGLYIPCIPAILMTKKLTHQEIVASGALPCIGFISLTEYLDALEGLDIKWRVTGL